MPRDNLLNSACLELFEFIKREDLKPLILHLVETCGPRLKEITYVDTFQNLIRRYDQLQGFNPDADTTLFSNDNTPTTNRTPNVNGNRWSGVKDMDATEEAYFNTSDDEEDENTSPKPKKLRSSNNNNNSSSVRDHVLTNGVTSSPMLKSLVDYPSDEDDLDAMDTHPSSSPSSTSTIPTSSTSSSESQEPKLSPSPLLQTPPPERLSEKRRREEDNDEDELGKLSTTSKRRNSGSSVSSTGSAASNGAREGGNTLKRKKPFVSKRDGGEAGKEGGDGKVKRIEISLGGKGILGSTTSTSTTSFLGEERGEAEKKGDDGG